MKEQYNGFKIIRDCVIYSPFEMFPEVRATKFIRDYTEVYDYNTGERITGKRKVDLGTATEIKHFEITHTIAVKAPASQVDKLLETAIDKYNSLGFASKEFFNWIKSTPYEITVSQNHDRL